MKDEQLTVPKTQLSKTKKSGEKRLVVKSDCFLN